MKKKKALVIYNPISGSRTWKDVPKGVRSVLEANGYTVTWVETQAHNKKGWIESLVHRNLSSERREREGEAPYGSAGWRGRREPLSNNRIVVVGGDGTVNDVTGEMVRARVKAPLMIVPQGSGNLLARMLGVSLVSVKQAVRQGLAGKAQPLDVLCINKTHYGLIGAGCGYDVVLMQNTSRGLKRIFGFSAYVWTFLKTFFFHRAHRYHLTVDEKRQTVMAKTILVINGLPGGSSPLVKKILGQKILPNDGHLDVLVLNPRSLWNLFKRSEQFQHFTGQSVLIKNHEENRFQIDGEVFEGKILKVKLLPKALNVVGVQK